MTVDHGARAHAKWSASKTERNWHCAGALALEHLGPPDKENIHGARGTACHQVSEKCLRSGNDAWEYFGTVEKTKEHEITIDEELVNSAQVYVDYVRGRMKQYRDETGEEATLAIEQRFDFSLLGGPFEAGGTGDAVLWFPKWGLIEVVDLKNGMKYVEADENKQLRSYAVGTLLANPGLDATHVMSTVVQPRLSPEPRSETLHVGDLIDWTADLLAAMRRSGQAEAEFASVTGDLTMEAWSEKWLTPGQCSYCPAEGFCPAKRKRAIENVDPAIIERWFHDITPKINTLDLADPARVAQDLDGLDEMEEWIKSRRAYAHHIANSGIPIPGYQLVEKIGNRKWACEDEAKLATDLEALTGLSRELIYEVPGVRSVAQIEKVLGSKKKHLVENMWHRPVTGTNLVSVDKTTRPAVRSTADKYFQN